MAKYDVMVRCFLLKALLNNDKARPLIRTEKKAEAKTMHSKNFIFKYKNLKSLT